MVVDAYNTICFIAVSAEEFLERPWYIFLRGLFFILNISHIFYFRSVVYSFIIPGAACSRVHKIEDIKTVLYKHQNNNTYMNMKVQVCSSEHLGLLKFLKLICWHNMCKWSQFIAQRTKEFLLPTGCSISQPEDDVPPSHVHNPRQQEHK